MNSAEQHRRMQASAEKEPQLWDNMEESEDEDIPIFPLIFSLAFFVLGIVLGMHLKLEPANQDTSKTIPQNYAPGNFIILENNTTSITFEGFEGNVTWYQLQEFNNPDPFYANNHLQPIGTLEIAEKQPLQVPQHAKAVLVSGKAVGEKYDMIITTN